MAEPPFTQQDVIDAEDVDWEESKEPWCVYKLKDGTTLKVHLALSGVKRLSKYDQYGNPIYLIQAQNVVRVEVPKELKQKPKLSMKVT